MITSNDVHIGCIAAPDVLPSHSPIRRSRAHLKHSVASPVCVPRECSNTPVCSSADLGQFLTSCFSTVRSQKQLDLVDGGPSYEPLEGFERPDAMARTYQHSPDDALLHMRCPAGRCHSRLPFIHTNVALSTVTPLKGVMYINKLKPG